MRHGTEDEMAFSHQTGERCAPQRAGTPGQNPETGDVMWRDDRRAYLVSSVSRTRQELVLTIEEVAAA